MRTVYTSSVHHSSIRYVMSDIIRATLNIARHAHATFIYKSSADQALVGGWFAPRTESNRYER